MKMKIVADGFYEDDEEKSMALIPGMAWRNDLIARYVEEL